MNIESHRIVQASQLFLKYQDFVKGLAYRYAPLPGYAEDIAQQVYLEFVSNIERFDLEKDIQPLLHTITKNTALRIWTQRTKSSPENLRKIAEHIQAFTLEEPESSNLDLEVASLQRCLQTLPERSHALIMQHYFDGVSMVEIAKAMQASDKSVRKAFCKIRDKLRVCIRKVMNGESPRV